MCLCVYFHVIWLDPCLHILICLDLCFHMLLFLDLCSLHALCYLVLGFAMLDALSEFMFVWLHPMLRRPCLDVTIWDASP